MYLMKVYFKLFSSLSTGAGNFAPYCILLKQNVFKSVPLFRTAILNLTQFIWCSNIFLWIRLLIYNLWILLVPLSLGNNVGSPKCALHDFWTVKKKYIDVIFIMVFRSNKTSYTVWIEGWVDRDGPLWSVGF